MNIRCTNYNFDVFLIVKLQNLFIRSKSMWGQERIRTSLSGCRLKKELDYKEDWGPKNWCFQTVVLEKIFENPLGCKEIKPVSPKGNQLWIFIDFQHQFSAEVPSFIIGRTSVEALLLWPTDVKSWLIGKDPDAGKDWGQEKGGQMMRWLDGVTDSVDMNLSNSRRQDKAG